MTRARRGRGGALLIIFLVIIILCLTAALVVVLRNPHLRYLPVFEEQARAAQQEAWQEHPAYPDALQLMREAEALRAKGQLAESYVQFMEAKEAFTRCEPYSTRYEEAAVAAQQEAMRLRPDHPVLKRGEEHMAMAREYAQNGEYDKAQQHFQQAEFFFRYDDTWEREAVYAAALADEEHPAYQEAGGKLAQARALLQTRPLTQASVELARELFDEVVQDLADAMPYDEVLERVAAEARAAADQSSPVFKVAEAVYQEGLALKKEGKYAQAYVRFARARDNFLEICSGYIAAEEQMTEQAMEQADQESPLYQKAITPLNEAELALESGNYVFAYRKFREARDLFRRALSFDRSLPGAAEAAREHADRNHPRFAQGQNHLLDAQVKLRLGDYRAAAEAFKLAELRFSQAVPYDASLEERARNARQEANPEVPVSYAAGELAFQRGEEARKAFRYEDAYGLFLEAARHFRSAQFDSGIRKALEEVKASADPESPSYAMGQANEQEGQELFQQGNGPAAASKYRMALISYTSATRTADTEVQPPDLSGIHTEDDEEARAEREARQQAEKSRNDALGLKEERDGWQRDNIINRATLIYFRQGTTHWKTAEAAYQQEAWDKAEQEYKAAIAAWLRVSSKAR